MSILRIEVLSIILLLLVIELSGSNLRVENKTKKRGPVVSLKATRNKGDNECKYSTRALCGMDCLGEAMLVTPKQTLVKRGRALVPWQSTFFCVILPHHSRHPTFTTHTFTAERQGVKEGAECPHTQKKGDGGQHNVHSIDSCQLCP